MAKYDVTYSCGHNGVIELYGPGAERERKLKWLASEGICPECYKAQLEAELGAFEEEHCLPALKGTEKQVAWARKIRKEQVTKALEIVEKAKGDDKAKAFWQWLVSKTESKFWISVNDKPIKLVAMMWKEEQ